MPEIVARLKKDRRLILTAPPGAGKTTRVPPALAEALPQGKILVLQPRRVAARAVARRMAIESGQPLGQQVGYQVRHDRRAGPNTRILLLTEGLLSRKLAADALLEDAACVVLDEFHERSVHADLALALLRELSELREDFHLLVMSATLEGLVEPLRDYLGGCAQLHCPLRGHPLRVDYQDRPDERPLAAQVRSGLLRLLQADEDDGGDVLVFLPGAGAIARCHRLLDEQGLPGHPEIVDLFGAQSAAEQDRALAPGARRRVVLATNLAESSLTVPGVRAVLDSGRVRRLRFDRGSGLDRLQEERVSQAGADQRAGRAGRLGPGRALRLWLASEHPALPPQEEAEIHRVDLAPLLLSLLNQQTCDPHAFDFFEAPPTEALDQGLALLRSLGALPGAGFRLTDLGRRMAALPLHPRLARLLCDAADAALGGTGASLCALLSELDLSRRPAEGPSTLDLESLRTGQGGWLEHRRVREALGQLRRSLPAGARQDREPATEKAVRRLVLAAYPDRLARRQAPGHRQAVLIGGRGLELDDGGALGRAELFLALQAEAGRRGQRSRGRVFLALAVDRSDLRAVFAERLRTKVEAVFDPESQAVSGIRRERFGELILSEQAGQALPPGEGAEVLSAAALERFEFVFQPDEAAAALLARLRFAARHLPERTWPAVDEAALRRRLGEQCQGRRSFAELRRLDWKGILAGELSRPQRQLLREQVPERIRVPSGRELAIAYTDDPGDPPVLEVKLQEMFGARATPRIAAGRVPLTLRLLAPNGRPAQVTQDLESFWREGYALVRKELRGRYPKHPWPDDPTTAAPTARTKRRS